MTIRCTDVLGKSFDAFVSKGCKHLESRRCFFVSMYLRRVSRRTHQAAFRRFFLPALGANASCVVFGIDPQSLEQLRERFSVSRAGAGWVVGVTENNAGDEAPFWLYDNGTRTLEYTVLVTGRRITDLKFLRPFLREVWDPKVIMNPGATVGRKALRYARSRSADTHDLWFAYRIHPGEMRIGIIGSVAAVSRAYRIALEEAKAKHLSDIEHEDPYALLQELQG